MNFKIKLNNFNDKLSYLFVLLGSILGSFLFIRSCINKQPSKGYLLMTLLCFLCVFYYSKRYLKIKERNDIFDEEETEDNKTEEDSEKDEEN